MGDKVLQQVSSIMRSSLSGSDIVCRYGNEEFSLLLPEAGWLDALSKAERIRSAVSAKAVDGVQVSVSMGLSSLEFKPGRPSELLEQADKALCHAKNSGRNKAVVYNEVPVTLPDENCGDGRIVDAENPKIDQGITYKVAKALLQALAHRDAATAEHSRKVGNLCVAAARSLMTKDECAILETAARLHDIGKLGIPDAILLKPVPLLEKERKVMKEHERRSVEIIASNFSCPEMVEIVKYASQWFDGSNAEDDLPLKGKQIPLGARILNIADAFHAMVSDRPYRKARSHAEGCHELRRFAGTQFDPVLVEHFIAIVDVAKENTQMADEAVEPDAVEQAIDENLECMFSA
jgi:HD-GYP domain-containing protein (c-di-GMP phosphodiesterase class II)